MALRWGGTLGWQIALQSKSRGFPPLMWSLGVGMMVVAGVVLALAGVVFLLACCLVAGS